MSETEITTISDTPSAPDNVLNRTRFCVTRLHTCTQWITCGLCSSNLICSHSLVFCVGKIKIYRTIILPVVLYGCETWSLTLREERSLRVFENRVLGRVFESKRNEVTGEWRKLHNEELNDLYSLPNIVRVVK